MKKVGLLCAFVLCLCVSFQIFPAQAEGKNLSFALDTWGKILNIPPQDTYAMIRVTQVYVQKLAGQIKTGQENFSAQISPSDTKEALKLLNETSNFAADLFAGNGDGACSAEEFEAFKKQYKLQYATILDMMLSYK